MADLVKAQKIVEEQEAKLQFDHFSADDAWKLGSFMVDEMREKGVPISIALWQLNGKVVFQYVPEGTSTLNVEWMERKFNTVALNETSSMLFDITLHNIGVDLSEHNLSRDEFAGCGGGFPIRVKGTGIVMVLTVSALPHVEDHGFIVDCLSKYLGVEVPKLDMDIPMF